MEKPKRNRVTTTKRMMTALEQLLAEVGVEGLTITKLADKAGVSKVLFYRYFGNLEGLLEYYIKMGGLIPSYPAPVLAQMRPAHANDLATIWSGNALDLFRQMRVSLPARELFMASVKTDTMLSDMVSAVMDREFTFLVEQLSFVKGSDHKAISAVVLGALSYLTIQAQLDRSVIGLNMRVEGDWMRIEKAVKLIYRALAQMAIDSPIIELDLKPMSIKFEL